ncbi:MAG TPA: hypothetical protein VK498_16285 [Ferruginibacter sp.]|nr:hypothetical protein [Ferruginibacter sp.]
MPDQLFKSVFNSADRAALEEISGEFPYFSLAHFYLLKLTGQDDSKYVIQAAKAAIHINNPYYLQHLLTEVPQINGVEEPSRVTGDGVAPMETGQAIEKTDDKPVESPKIPEAQAAAQVEKEEMIFEPLYATDYFASQGIKLNTDIPPTDKLGKQLKSFTDWLKTMKKVHENTFAPDSQLDPAVQNLAEKSNREEDIITESMAEVFAGQGKYDKAIDTYRKLSLLNPSKSAYFAAKIENLNHH